MIRLPESKARELIARIDAATRAEADPDGTSAFIPASARWLGLQGDMRALGLTPEGIDAVIAAVKQHLLRSEARRADQIPVEMVAWLFSGQAEIKG